jgi:hypothetical protein
MEVTLSGTWSGPISGTIAENVRIVKVGKQVTLELQPFLATASNGTNVNFTYSIALPSWATPDVQYGSSTGILFPAVIYNASVPDTGFINIAPSTNVLRFGRIATNNWNGNQLAGIAGGQAVTYLTL